MSDNTNSAHERTASIDLAQLDKTERLAQMFRGITAFHPGHFHHLMSFANSALEVCALARRSLTSGAPAHDAGGQQCMSCNGTGYSTGSPRPDGRCMHCDGNGKDAAAPVHDVAAPSTCQWPVCQPEHVQQEVAAQVHRELYSGAAAKTELLERVRDAVADSLTGLYHCGRVWSAWGYGTMSQDDFSPAEEDDDIIENITSAAIAAISAGAAAKTEQGDEIRGPLTDAQREECRTLYNNLKHLQCGGIYVADDVIRRAAVFGYMNGRKDFGTPATAAGAGSAQPRDTCAEMRALCSSCGGTGDVHSIDGEWRGECNCPAGISLTLDRLKIAAKKTQGENEELRAALARAPSRDAGQEEASTQTVPDGAAGTVEKDAARYRWIRKVENGNAAWDMFGSGLGGSNLDSAIDAAIEAHNKAGKEQG